MPTVLATVMGSHDMTVATYEFRAEPDVSAIARTVVGVHTTIEDGFSECVQRVGDPTPIVQADGRCAVGAALVADKVAELASRTAYDSVVVVGPATWSRYAVSALGHELAMRDVSAVIVDRAAASDRWLRSVGLLVPDIRAVVVEVGESETVVSHSSSERGRSVVITDHSDGFGVETVDRVLLSHVVDQLTLEDTPFESLNPAQWDGLPELAGRVSAARRRLDTSPVATVEVDLGGERTIRVVRSELDEMIADEVERMSSCVAEAVARIAEPVDRLVLHGAAASIPFVVQALSTRCSVPVVVAEAPDLVVVNGAVLWGARIVEPVLVEAPADRGELDAAPSIPRPSLWTRSRLVIAGGAVALLLVFGGITAAEAIGDGNASTPAPMPGSTSQPMEMDPNGR